MKIDLSSVSLRSIFPFMGMFGGIAVSKKGTLSFGWELFLPRIDTVSEDRYNAYVEAYSSALRVLPEWTVVHRQDIYTYDSYKPERKAGDGFLKRCSDAHFDGRPFLTHKAYLFVTYASRGLIRKDGKSSGLFGLSGSGERPGTEALRGFYSKCSEFMQILSTMGGVASRELTTQDWLGEGLHPGIIQRYMTLGGDEPYMSDIAFTPDAVRVNGKQGLAFTLGESSYLPIEISDVSKNEALSGFGTQVLESSGAKIGPMLDCEHVVNNYIVIPPQGEVQRELEAKYRRMNASISARENAANIGEIDGFLTAWKKYGLFAVKAHTNIIAWGHPSEGMDLASKISAALLSMDCASVRCNYNLPVLWYAGIPGCGFDIGEENLMILTEKAALCLMAYETFDNGIGEGDLLFCDRTRNTPVKIDVDEVAAMRGLVTTYNKFICGPSGSGKSFFTNKLLRHEYEAGAEVFIIDRGDSYEGQTAVIHEETGGKDGIYMSWSKENPLTFNAFIGFTEWLDADGNLQPDDNGVNFILSVLKTIYDPEGGWTSYNESVLKQTVRDFVEEAIREGRTEEDSPVMDDYYNFLDKKVKPLLSKGKYMVGTDEVGSEIFDLKKFHIALKAYSKKGEFAFFLNDPHPKDLFKSRWTVFELDRLSQVNDQKFYSLCVLAIMHAFDWKMRTSSGRKVLAVDEAWKAIMNETMAPYLKGLWKTSRKFSTAAIVITQELEDITSSDVIKDAILANSDTRILLDQSRNRNILLDESVSKDEDSDVRKLLSLTPEDINLLLSLNRNNNPAYRYREVFIKYANGTSGVYATEVSPEEAIVYESNKSKKAPFLKLAEQCGSYIKAAKALSKK